MELKYNRDDIDENLSMGENGLLYYSDILEKNPMSRIIISTILKLHKKGYVEINNSNQNELIIKIRNGIEILKPSEAFIYECLKTIDKDSNGILTLNEFNISENKIFTKNKKNIRELIIQEAMSDELISVKKIKEKRKIFFRTLEILIILIYSILSLVIEPYKQIIFAIIVTLIIANHQYNFIKPKDKLKELKNKLVNDEIMKYSSKTENNNILIEFVVYIIICYINLFILNQIYTITSYAFVIFIIEALIAVIFAIILYVKFLKMNFYTNKAEINRRNLQGIKQYLIDYSLIKDRKAIEIYLWENYLIFAVLLGINNSITNELKLNLSNANMNEKRKIQYDFYENKYFYINDKNEKIYLDK